MRLGSFISQYLDHNQDMAIATDHTAASRTAASRIADRTVEYLAVAGCPWPTSADSSSVTAATSLPSIASFGLHQGPGLAVSLGQSFADRAQKRHTPHHSHHSFEGPVPWAKDCPLKPSWPASGASSFGLSFAI